MAPGGAQQYYGVVPDISTFAKALANGFPLAVVVGKREFMNIIDPRKGDFLSSKEGVSFFGTYNGNQMSLAAARATLTELKSGKIQKQLHERVRWLSKQFGEVASSLGVEAILVALGGKFQAYFIDEAPVDYRTAMKTDAEKYAVFRRAVLEGGVMMHPLATSHHGVTWSHTREAMDEILVAMENGLAQAKKT
jgi:glutamate-1-semialdehyde 2,1-aminomutase